MKRQEKMSKLSSKILKILLFVLLFFVSFAPASFASNPANTEISTFNDDSEQILNYYSKITVNSDSSLDIIEEITVRVRNVNINHGIYRDFPTIYHGPYGLREKVGFEILDIRKENLSENNGSSKEPYSTESQSNGVRVYIGDSEKIIDPGDYRYFIHYKTTYQLADLEKSDQLYWNVTGNGWEFPINQATAEIILPAKYGKNSLDLRAFQGPQESTSESKKITVSNTSTKTIITIQSSRRLEVREGLTIKINFPKGDVKFPDGYVGPWRWYRDNLDVPILLLGLIILLAFCVYSWRKYGVDPKKLTVIPRFEPPFGFSPAGINYLGFKKYDTKAFTAAILNLAVNGFIKIKEVEEKILFFTNKTFELEKLKEPMTEMPQEEKLILNELFGEGENLYRFNTSYDAKLANLVQNFSSKTKDLYFTKYYKYNFLQIFLSILIFSLFYAAGFVASFFDPSSYFISPFILLVYGILGFILVNVFFNAKNSTLKIISAVGFIALATIDLFVIFQVGIISIYPVLYGFIGLTILMFFCYLIQTPTKEGSEKIAEIEGFKMYLLAAEAEDLKVINKEHPKTLDLFQKYLPFAIALNVETQWTSQFEEQIKQAQIDDASNYAAWYVGSTSFNSINSISNITSSITSSITSASTSSSSGGSSGGGGGGGGGGGW